MLEISDCKKVYNNKERKKEGKWFWICSSALGKCSKQNPILSLPYISILVCKINNQTQKSKPTVANPNFHAKFQVPGT